MVRQCLTDMGVEYDVAKAADVTQLVLTGKRHAGELWLYPKVLDVAGPLTHPWHDLEIWRRTTSLVDSMGTVPAKCVAQWLRALPRCDF